MMMNKITACAIGLIIAGGMTVKAEDFNWKANIKKMEKMFPASNDGTAAKITEIALEDVDGDGISECFVKTSNYMEAAFTCGNGKKEYGKDYIKMVACTDNNGIRMAAKAIRTYQGASPGYEDEKVFKLVNSNVTDRYTRNANPVRKGKTVTLTTKCSVYNNLTKKWDTITESEYEKKTAYTGDLEYSFGLNWESCSDDMLHDMMEWEEGNSNIDKSTMEYLRDRIENEMREYVSHHADDSDADWQTVINLLNVPYVPLKAEDLTQMHRVRSIQIKGDGSIYGYDYFKCNFSWEVRALHFHKTAGSQRKFGMMERLSNEKIAMDGFWYYGVDGQQYDQEHRCYGVAQKTYDGRIFMIFPKDNYNNFEIYLFAK